MYFHFCRKKIHCHETTIIYTCFGKSFLNNRLSITNLHENSQLVASLYNPIYEGKNRETMSRPIALENLIIEQGTVCTFYISHVNHHTKTVSVNNVVCSSLWLFSSPKRALISQIVSPLAIRGHIGILTVMIEFCWHMDIPLLLT